LVTVDAAASFGFYCSCAAAETVSKPVSSFTTYFSKAATKVAAFFMISFLPWQRVCAALSLLDSFLTLHTGAVNLIHRIFLLHQFLKR
jgi:hypothetical protein